MTTGRKIFIRIMVAGWLITSWIIYWEHGVTAQEHQHRHTPANAGQAPNPLPATEENLARGRTLYEQNCAACHGVDGKAQTEKAATMKVKPANLTVHHSHTAGDIFSVITNGMKSSGMPAFATRLNETERWQIALHVQQLSGAQHTTSRGAGATARDPHQGHTQSQPQSAAKNQTNSTAHAGHEMPNATTANAKHRVDGSAMADHDMSDRLATVTGGPFRSMRALGSGTALQPASTPLSAWMWMPGEWMLMLHGELKIGFNHQGGRVVWARRNRRIG